MLTHKEVIDLSKGNPGALSFLMSMPPDLITNKIKSITTLRGTNIYVLWSDLAGKDMQKCAKICSLVPDNILEDACNRQDYSGIKLIEPFLK